MRKSVSARIALACHVALVVLWTPARHAESAGGDDPDDGDPPTAGSEANGGHNSANPRVVPGRSVEVPPDPFAEDYRPPRATEVGTTAGQFRAIGTLGLRHVDGIQSLAHGTLELMTVAIIGVRLSSALALGPADPSVIAWTAGPSLHLLPYRRVDVSAFFEAGPARFSTQPNATWSPQIVVGASIDVSLTSYWFVRLEGHFAWAVYREGAGAESYRAPGATLGIGLGL